MSPHRRRLIWQIYPPFLVIILLAIAALTWLFSRDIDRFFRDQTRLDLEARAHVVQPQVETLLAAGKLPELERLFRQISDKTGTRLTFIDPTGRVLADSDEQAQRMDNHGNRPEVAAALRGQTGVSTRYSHTLQQSMMYVAIPLPGQSARTGCLRAALPLSRINQVLDRIRSQALLGALPTAVLATLCSLWVSRRISRPLEEMKQGAQRFAEGKLDRRLPAYPGVELSTLADAMNQMAAQLDERIRTIIDQRNEQEAVLASMVEGVLAIDRQETIIRINQAAATLLNLDRQVVGRKVRAVLRKPDLLQFVDRALSSTEPVEEDISLYIGGVNRFLQAHGTPLSDARGNEIGALIVFNDMTRLQRLETIRRDFVANVSHELKTPITAIKGSVETLMNGAMDDPEDSQRFLSIIVRQSDRLNAIIEDLLALSRIEQGEEHTGIELRSIPLAGVILGALQACQVKAHDKGIHLEPQIPDRLEWSVNAALLEQALVNLIDNAVKYSPHGQKVLVAARISRQQLEIDVQDWGPGIAAEHVPRLFERFYRIDKARSRNLGGTGLGLAIVKHIVQAHHGQIRVHSQPGQGSTFTISLPNQSTPRQV